MKALKKTLLFLSLAVGVVVIAATVSLFLFKDRIIQQFVHQANKQLATPVKIGHIGVSLFGDFPNLAIELTDVYIEDSHPGDYPLFTAQYVTFYVNPVEAWKGKYSIRGLQIVQSETNLRVNKKNVGNYTILKDTADTGNAVAFDLRNVKISHAVVTFIDQHNNQNHDFSTDALTASITAAKDVYHIVARGDVLTGQVGVGDKIFLRDKTFIADAKLDYVAATKTFSFLPSTLKLEESRFDVSGTYLNHDVGEIDLQVKGKDTDIQTILSLLPASFSKPFARYESQGEVFFDLSLKGKISKTRDPLLSIGFGFRDATVVHPDSRFKLQHTNLEGSFATPSFTSLDRAVLMLRGMEGELNNQQFKANFSLTNFDHPFITCDFLGTINAASLFDFVPMEGLKEVSGELHGDVSFEGEVEKLRHKATAQQVKANGSIELRHLNARVGDKQLRLDSLNGVLQFNHNDVALSNVRGNFEGTDFRLNGFFKNAITFLLFDNQPIGIETDLRSDFVDLDRLFEVGFGKEDASGLKFSISPNLHLNFNCDIRRMHYKRFRGENLRGDLLVKNQVAVSRKFSFDAMGGSITLNGIVDAKNPKAIDLVSGIKLKDVLVDSLFYVFQNFRQTFIQDKHLKGRGTADLNLEATWDESLHFYPETLVADVSATIHNGELNNFEPMQALSKYLDDEGLSKLRFAALKNEIHIENKTVIIPEMEIRSNVTSIKLSGRHTFDQQIDYRVVAPLRNKRKINIEEAGGAFEQDNAGRSKVFLKITGTTDNYKVSYDTDAVKKKIAADLKREVQELKDAFRLKGKKKQKEVELEKEDYFDWPDQ